MMTPKKLRFVAEYRKDLNATKAAMRAGYSKKTAHSQGPRLLEDVEIKAVLSDLTAKQLDRADLTAARTLEEMRRLAFANVQDLFNETGDLKPIHLLTREQASCIASIEVIMKNATAGDGKIDRVLKIRTWDKRATLEMLGKHFSLLVERVQFDMTDELLSKLDRARLRAAGKLPKESK